MENNQPAFNTKTRNKYLFAVAGLVVFNLVCYNLFIRTGGYSLDGQYQAYNPSYVLRTSLITFLVSLPLVGLVLGLLVALLPYRQLPYGKKYLRASLLSLMSLNGLFCAMLLWVIFQTLMGWYPPKEPTLAKGDALVLDFEKEVKALNDSSNYYFDKALNETNQGADPKTVAAKYGDKVRYFEKELDARYKTFQVQGKESNIDNKQYAKVILEVNKLIQPTRAKFDTLKKRGVDFEQ